MLDRYTLGKVNRISPEAPVIVVKVENEEDKPGGAGNVHLNLKALGANVIALGRIGEDQAGESLKQILKDASIDTSGILVEKNFKTPLKNRVIASSQQCLRVDYEEVSPYHLQ